LEAHRAVAIRVLREDNCHRRGTWSGTSRRSIHCLGNSATAALTAPAVAVMSTYTDTNESVHSHNPDRQARPATAGSDFAWCSPCSRLMRASRPAVCLGRGSIPGTACRGLRVSNCAQPYGSRSGTERVPVGRCAEQSCQPDYLAQNKAASDRSPKHVCSTSLSCQQLCSDGAPVRVGERVRRRRTLGGKPIHGLEPQPR
jgi:hypothetical protein